MDRRDWLVLVGALALGIVVMITGKLVGGSRGGSSGMLDGPFIRLAGAGFTLFMLSGMIGAWRARRDNSAFGVLPLLGIAIGLIVAVMGVALAVVPW
jgi:hypothetical protein